MKKNKKAQGGPAIAIAAIFVFVAVFLVLMLGFDTVDANHLGVQVKLGQIKGVQDAGMQWTGLFTHVYQYDMRTRKNVIDMSGDNSAVDKTGQAVYATININYKIKHDKNTIIRLYSEVGTNDVIADRLNIDAIVAEGFKQATVKYDALEILDKRQEVKELAKENIRANFPKNFFEIQDIVITNIDFSENFKNAIEAKKTAEQDALKEQNQLEVVKFQQQQEIEKYKAEAEKMRLQKAEVSALLNEQKMIEKWDGKLPQYLIITPDSQGMFLQLAQGQGTVGE